MYELKRSRAQNSGRNAGLSSQFAPHSLCPETDGWNPEKAVDCLPYLNSRPSSISLRILFTFTMTSVGTDPPTVPSSSWTLNFVS